MWRVIICFDVVVFSELWWVMMLDVVGYCALCGGFLRTVDTCIM